MPQTGSIAMGTMVAVPHTSHTPPWYDSGVRSVEWAIMRAPARAYAELTAASPGATMTSTIGRPLVAALVIGAAMATTASDVLDGAFLRTTLAWSFAVLVQVAAATALVSSAPARAVSRGRAFDLLFAANGPWMLWLAAFTLWTETTTPLGRPLHSVTISLLVPGIWTAILVHRYCRIVLGATPTKALLRTAAHQSAIWLFGSAYFFWAVQGWPRIVGILTGWKS
jgi:hypothetical protein